MSSAPESTSLCSAFPCYVPATPPHAQASGRWHSDLTTQERTQMSNSRFRRTITPLADAMALAMASTTAMAADGVSPALQAAMQRDLGLSGPQLAQYLKTERLATRQAAGLEQQQGRHFADRKSTRLNSSH